MEWCKAKREGPKIKQDPKICHGCQNVCETGHVVGFAALLCQAWYCDKAIANNPDSCPHCILGRMEGGEYVTTSQQYVKRAIWGWRWTVRQGAWPGLRYHRMQRLSALNCVTTIQETRCLSTKPVLVTALSPSRWSFITVTSPLHLLLPV